MIDNQNNFVEFLISIPGVTTVDPTSGSLIITRSDRTSGNELFNYDNTNNEITLKTSNGTPHTISGLDIAGVSIDNLTYNSTSTPIATCSALLDCTRTSITNMSYDNFFDISSLMDLVGSLNGSHELYMNCDAVTYANNASLSMHIV
jgi:hypothetical protein